MNRETVGALLGFIGIIVLGIILGYIGGWVVWWLFGQIQLFLHMDFPYCAIYPPPLLYQIAWTVGGSIFLFAELGKKSGRRSARPSAPERKPSTVIEHIEKATIAKEGEEAKRRQQIELQIKQEPSDVGLSVTLARAFRPDGAYVIWSGKRKEDALRAEAEYQKAIQLNPNSIEAHLELGLLYVAMRWQIPERTDTIIKAEDELKEALKIDPNLSDAHKALGQVYRYQKRHDESKKHLKLALKSSPNDKMALYWLGIVSLDLGKVEEATTVFQEIFPEYDRSHHKIERTELVSDFFTHKVERLGLALIDKVTNRRIKVEEVQDFGWLD